MSQITAKVIADSVAPDGSRLTSVQVRQPTFILAETNTHAALSKSSSSARAKPIHKVLKEVWSDPFMPVKWGSHKAGMQAGPELCGWRKFVVKALWKLGSKINCGLAWGMWKVGLAKEVGNRVLTPWMMTDTLLTGTEWKNFFALRDHYMAQPEMQVLAGEIREAIKASNPRHLKEGQLHLPYITRQEISEYKGTEDEWKLPCMSSARSARNSYSTHDNKKPPEDKDLNLFETLAISKPPHASPLAHIAFVDSGVYRSRNFQGNWKQFREVLETEGWGHYPPTGDTSAADYEVGSETK